MHSIHVRNRPRIGQHCNALFECVTSVTSSLQHTFMMLIKVGRSSDCLQFPRNSTVSEHSLALSLFTPRGTASHPNTRFIRSAAAGSLPRHRHLQRSLCFSFSALGGPGRPLRDTARHAIRPPPVPRPELGRLTPAPVTTLTTHRDV